MNYSLFNLFFLFLKLGCYCFGGPIAHFAIFHREFVERRKWIDEKSYLDLVVLCQSLPGASSSQVVLALGMKERHTLGAIVALTGFALPSCTLMLLAAYSFDLFEHYSIGVHGLKIAALAAIAQAIFQLTRNFYTNIVSIIPIGTSTILAAILAGFSGQICAILSGVLFGLFFCKESSETPKPHFSHLRRTCIPWILFFGVLIAGPLIGLWSNPQALELFNSFYETGALVFGGGHVILPLLHAKTVATGLIDENSFLAGYGLAQALPGPLLSFAAFLGGAMSHSPNGLFGALICIVAIYLPSIFILSGTLPFWEKWRHLPYIQSAFKGIGLATIGLLLAVLITWIIPTTILTSGDALISLLAFLLLLLYHLPQWLIVLLCFVLYAQ